MGKHKNKTQNAIFLNFMEKNPDIAKGFTRRDKPLVESLWKELAEFLNSAGPPQKDANGWKKIWTEWKSEIKKKLAHNKSEARATGGGPFSKYQLTETEETIIRLCSIAQSVEGVSGVALGLSEDTAIDSDSEMPSTSSKRQIGSHNTYEYSTPKRVRTESTGERLKAFLEEDNERKLEINAKLDELLKIEKENASSLRRVYRAIEKSNETIASAVVELKQEFASVGTRILTAMQEKNEIKKKQLDLEILKFDYIKDKNNNTNKF